MAMQVCMGAMMQCNFGAAPSSLVVLPANRTLTGTPAANIMDSAPISMFLRLACVVRLQSYGRRGHRRRIGRLDTDALCARDRCALGSRISYRVDC